MSFPCYPEYKDSGVEWLGEVPGHWEVKALKNVISRIESGVSVNAIDTPAAEGEIGVLKTSCVYRGWFDPAENKAVVPEEYERVACPVTAGTLIVSRMNTPDLVGAAGMVGESHPRLFLPDRLWQVHFAEAHAAFIHYWTHSPLYRAQVQQVCAGASSSMQNLAQDQFRAFTLALPPVREQTAIAAFLDRETAKIDALVAEQQSLIALLKEKRQALISHAVTKGLDPDVPMKGSGVAWLGEVPAHWEVLKLKHVSPEITVGIVVEPSKYYCETGVPALRSLNVKSGSILLENLVFISEEANEALAKSCLRAGDIVAVRSGQPGTSAVIPEELDGCNCIDLLIIRRPKGGSEHYLCWYLSSDPALRQFAEGSGGAIQQHFNVSTATSLQVATPPPAEQLRIDQFLRSEVSKFDALVLEAEATIDLLQERRTALISAAVTGKIDVRRLAVASADRTPEPA
jgi:type I restriction enzyme S subunit